MKQIAFRLQIFEGPLDLLLHLIHKNKVSIYDIPISEITEQYMDYIAEMDHYDIEVSSEFLVLAANLLYIKSKMLLPKDGEGQEEEDPRLELAQRLEEYKRMRMAADYLREREFAGGNIYYKPRDFIQPVLIDESLKQITLEDLYAAAQELADKLNRKKPVRIEQFAGVVGRDPIPVFTKVKQFVKRLMGGVRVRFLDLFRGVRTRDEAVASFLAVLELMKMNRIKVGTAEEAYEITYVGKGELNEDELEYTDN